MELSFFTLPEDEQWKKENNNGDGYMIKYYKVGSLTHMPVGLS